MVDPIAAPASAAPVELSVVVPTFNERANLPVLVEKLRGCLVGVSWEVIVVDDDSPDGTAQVAAELAAAEPRVRCLRRIGRRGLASACIEGLLASTAPYLAVMDADLQHDESLLPRMLGILRAAEADVVIGSRYLRGTGVPGWDPRRQGMSRLATRLARLVLRVDVSDPMSGFFMLRREAFEDAVYGLSGIGFKLLLDILSASPAPLRVRELPYRFRDRLSGESKLDSRAVQDFLLVLLDRAIGRWIPPRFALFALVGGLGVVVHMSVLALLLEGLGVGFAASQTVAALAAMTGNFALNNELTYRDRRLRGRRWLGGWLSFALACSVGALANVGVAATLFANATNWVLSALAGILVGAVWNYAVTAFYTWNRPETARVGRRRGARAERSGFAETRARADAAAARSPTEAASASLGEPSS
jgi:dolichol-phosphate mannosyltransferase